MRLSVCDAPGRGSQRASAVAAEGFSSSNRFATEATRQKQRLTEDEIEDESNQVGYEESRNHPGPCRHSAPVCVPIDISESKKKCCGEDAKREAKPKRVRHGAEKSLGSKYGTARVGSKIDDANRDRQCGDRQCDLGQNIPSCGPQ